MAQTKKILEEDEVENKQWQEATLIKTFKLNRITDYQTPLMQEWLEVSLPTFDAFEQVLFRRFNFEMQFYFSWNQV